MRSPTAAGRPRLHPGSRRRRYGCCVGTQPHYAADVMALRVIPPIIVTLSAIWACGTATQRHARMLSSACVPARLGTQNKFHAAAPVGGGPIHIPTYRWDTGAFAAGDCPRAVLVLWVGFIHRKGRAQCNNARWLRAVCGHARPASTRTAAAWRSTVQPGRPMRAHVSHAGLQTHRRLTATHVQRRAGPGPADLVT